MVAYSAASHNLEDELYAIINCLDLLIKEQPVRQRCMLSLKLLNDVGKNNFLNQNDLECLVSLLTEKRNNYTRVERV